MCFNNNVTAATITSANIQFNKSTTNTYMIQPSHQCVEAMWFVLPVNKMDVTKKSHTRTNISAFSSAVNPSLTSKQKLIFYITTIDCLQGKK